MVDGAFIGRSIESLIMLVFGFYLFVIYFRKNIYNPFKVAPIFGEYIEKHRWIYLIVGISSLLTAINSFFRFI